MLFHKVLSGFPGQHTALTWESSTFRTASRRITKRISESCFSRIVMGNFLISFYLSFLEVSSILSVFTDKLERQVLQSRMKNSVCLQKPTLPTYADSSGRQQSELVTPPLLYSVTRMHVHKHKAIRELGTLLCHFPSLGQSTEEVEIHGQYRPDAKLKLNIITTLTFVNKIISRGQGTIWLS